MNKRYFCYINNFVTGKFRKYIIGLLDDSNKFDKNKIEDSKYFNSYFLYKSKIDFEKMVVPKDINIDKSFEKKCLKNFSFFTEVIANNIKKNYNWKFYDLYINFLNNLIIINKFDKNFITGKNIRLRNIILNQIINNEKELEFEKIFELIKICNKLDLTHINFYVSILKKINIKNLKKIEKNNLLDLIFFCNKAKFKNPKFYNNHNENLIKKVDKIELMDIKNNKEFYYFLNSFKDEILENIELINLNNYHKLLLIIEKYQIIINRENFIFLCFNFLNINNEKINPVNFLKFYKSQVILENRIFIELNYSIELNEFHEKISYFFINNFDFFKKIEFLNNYSKSLMKSGLYNEKLIKFIIKNLMWLNIENSKNINKRNFKKIFEIFLDNIYFLSKYYILVNDDKVLKNKLFNYVNDILIYYYNFSEENKIINTENNKICLAIWSLGIYYEKGDFEIKKNINLLLNMLYKSEEIINNFNINQLYFVHLLLKDEILFDTVFIEKLKNIAYKISYKIFHKVSFLNYDICTYLDSLGIKYKLEDKIDIIDLDIVLLESQNNKIIDVHGYHHYFRNNYILKGNNILKKKILENFGYEYIEIDIITWNKLKEESKINYLKNKLNI